MSKKLYVIDDEYFTVNDKTGEVLQMVEKQPNLTKEKMQKLILLIMNDKDDDKNSGR